MLHRMSVGSSFLRGVGASITVPCPVSVLSYSPLHLHKPRRLLLWLLQRTQTKQLMYFWDVNSVWFLTVYLVA